MPKHINAINKTVRLACIGALHSAATATNAQKIEVGSYEFKDGSIYTGDLFNGKPNGVGRTIYKNGDVY